MLPFNRIHKKTYYSSLKFTFSMFVFLIYSGKFYSSWMISTTLLFIYLIRVFFTLKDIRTQGLFKYYFGDAQY